MVLTFAFLAFRDFNNRRHMLTRQPLLVCGDSVVFPVVEKFIIIYRFCLLFYRPHHSIGFYDRREPFGHYRQSFLSMSLLVCFALALRSRPKASQAQTIVRLRFR